MKILTSDDDDFLYEQLIRLLDQIKLVQSGSAIPGTLHRHKNIKIYLIEKQIQRIKDIETKYFTEDGLNETAIKSRQLKNNIVY